MVFGALWSCGHSRFPHCFSLAFRGSASRWRDKNHHDTLVLAVGPDALSYSALVGTRSLGRLGAEEKEEGGMPLNNAPLGEWSHGQHFE